jgi:glycosyltransferase involved in cell wall biosynthesis
MDRCTLVAFYENLINLQELLMSEGALMSYQLTGDLDVNSEVGVILPTYCEAENIAKLIIQIENLPLNASILVIDDSSPDETAEIVKKLQAKYGNILLCIRPEKSGLGTAITDGFKIFLNLKNSPRFVITMDADYSHNPKAILQLLSSMQCGCGIATGFLKQAIGSLHSETYEIQIETIKQALLRGFDITEVPILFVNRKRGKSKLTLVEVQSYISYILKTAAYGRSR